MQNSVVSGCCGILKPENQSKKIQEVPISFLAAELHQPQLCQISSLHFKNYVSLLAKEPHKNDMAAEKISL